MIKDLKGVTVMSIQNMTMFIEHLMTSTYEFCVNGGIYDDKMARKAFILDLLILFEIEQNKIKRSK